MTKLFHVNRKTISIAGCLVFLLSAVAVALNINNHQQSRDSNRRGQNEIVRQIQELPDQSLRILGNDDCPLRITEARVKEIPGALFTRLTGRVTNLATVSSLPEATLVNTSGQTVTKFFLAIRDPRSRSTRGLIREATIQPGESLVMNREDFVSPDRVTVADGNGQVRQRMVAPGMDSENRWIGFAARHDLFITIVRVEFEDGSSWMIREGGEVR